MNRIEELRKKKGLSQMEIARQIGISKKALYNYSHGAQIPSGVLQSLAELYHVPIDYLIGRTDNTTITIADENTDEAIAVVGFSEIICKKGYKVIQSED